MTLDKFDGAILAYQTSSWTHCIGCTWMAYLDDLMMSVRPVPEPARYHIHQECASGHLLSMMHFALSTWHERIHSGCLFRLGRGTGFGQKSKASLFIFTNILVCLHSDRPLSFDKITTRRHIRGRNIVVQLIDSYKTLLPSLRCFSYCFRFFHHFPLLFRFTLSIPSISHNDRTITH